MNTNDSGRKNVVPRWLNTSNFTGVLMIYCAFMVARWVFLVVGSLFTVAILASAIYLLSGILCFIEGMSKGISEKSRQSTVIFCLSLASVLVIISFAVIIDSLIMMMS
ncbi:hypothetical protein CVV43_02175 [Candidatus Saccharibacteria bacterium HGW-Saccharibacteria-1]|nr:MAG: hypothetical protein CVV43_02175 [Candidatus Saccharibacteria bacterium HGW-Saccharibacteria-1]